MADNGFILKNRMTWKKVQCLNLSKQVNNKKVFTKWKH